MTSRRKSSHPSPARGKRGTGRIPAQAAEPADPGQFGSRRDWLLALFLLAALLVAYSPALRGTPIWDDSGHLTKPELRSWMGLWRIWFDLGATQQYYPVTHTVFWIEHRLWGDWYMGYHLLNVVLHVISATLIVRLLRRLEIPGAWLAAAIWALHPVQAESVAWMSELKNALSGVFYFWSALIYLEFNRERKWSKWWAALGIFLLGLLAKSVIDTLPAAMLLVIYWKRGGLQWRRDIAPTIPFFGFGIAAGLFTSWVERTYIGAAGNEFALNLVQRVLIAGRAFWFYLGKLVWPWNLLFIYPKWDVRADAWWQYLFPALALLLLAALVLGRRRWRQGPLIGILYFAGTLFPALGFINIFPFRYSFVADHFQYLACLGPIVLAAGWLAGRVKALGANDTNQVELSCVLLLPLAGLTWMHCALYANVENLWRETIKGNPDCWMAYNNLSVIALDSGRPAEAMDEVKKALALYPRYADAFINLGNVLQYQGRQDDALAAYQQSIAIEPRIPLAQCNLGALLFQMRRFDEAETHIRLALEQEPDYPDATYYLAAIYLAKGQLNQAESLFRKTVELDPGLGNGHIYLAETLMKLGQIDEAISEFRTGLALKAGSAQTHYDLGMALMQRGQIKEAIAEWREVMKLLPSNASAPNEIAWVLATWPDATIRNGGEAVTMAQQALKITGGKEPVVLDTLAAAYAEAGNFPEAIETGKQALNLANEGKQTSLASQIAKHLQGYEAGQPFRDSPAAQH